MAAAGAPGHMPAESLGPAGFDGRHHLELGQADMPRIGLPPRRAMVRKMSASSSDGRGTQPRRQSGPTDRSTLSWTSFICSKGLTVLWIVLVATWA